MGGIKNKLNNKLSNKTLFSNLGSPARGAGSRRLTEGLFHRWGRYAKYLAISCLSLVLISTIGLNLYRTYSNDNIETSAVGNSSSGGELATQANIDPTSIALSISSSPSSSTGGNDANLSLSIPQGGGIATGRHTVTVETGSSVIGYDLMLSSDSKETSLVNGGNVDNEGNDSGSIIPTTTGILTSPVQLADKSYGYTLTNLDNDSSLANTDIWIGLKPNTNPDTIATVDEASLAIGQANTTSHNIYYGVNIQNPVGTRAGDYTAQIVYTVTATLHEPTIASISPTTYELGSNEGLDSSNRLPVTITGNHLSSTSRVYLTNSNTAASNAGTEYGCTNIQVASDGKSLTCTLPTDKTNSDLEAGTYNLTILADNGTAVLDNAFTYTKSSICRNADPDSACQVDIDDNMFPVAYDESAHSWYLVSKSSMERGYGSWYDYGDRKWANAVTMPDNLDEYCYYANKGGGTYTVAQAGGGRPCDHPDRYDIKTPFELASAYFNGEDIDCSAGNITMAGRCYISDFSALGFWTYIPRYAYKVMRYSVNDKYVSDSTATSNGGFEIVFETKDTPKKIPIACSNSNSNQYYQDCPGVSNTYGNDTGTSWATHPAFTWQYTQEINGLDKTYELNGFWIGKFETTGTRTAPTVKPNQHANVSEYVGEFYSAAKSIGVEDKNNQYGGASSDDTTSGLKQNSHNLAISTSHMLKNSEWGAVAYLSASKYGAGVNKVQINAAYLASGSRDADGDSSRHGVTGCGPEANGVEDRYDAGTLNATTIRSTTACGSADRAYNGTTGQYASTTNNVYGVYDMSGGAREYVTGSYTTNTSQSSTSYFSNATKPPYVDLYPDSIFTNNNTYTNNNQCTWATCGGHALYETKNVQPVSGDSQSWGGDYSDFVDSSGPWFARGGSANNGSYAGVFASSNHVGYTGDYIGFRVALITANDSAK